MIGKYQVAHLIGSTADNEFAFRSAELRLTGMGYICFAPAIYNPKTYEKCKELIDDMCYQKLLMCDICVVVTPEKMGKQTRKRIQECKELGKPVYQFTSGVLSLMPFERWGICND